MLVQIAALSSLGWASYRALRGDRPVAIGAAVMGLVLAGPWAAAGTAAWREGGPQMNVLTLIGSYGLGAATAFRLSRGRAARFAAMASATLTTVFAGYFYFHGLQELDEVLRGVSEPRVAEIIRGGSHDELLRLVQLASALVVVTALLLKPPTIPFGATFQSHLHSKRS